MEKDCGQRQIMTIDIGNTAMKVSVFEGETLVRSLAGPADSLEAVDAMMTFSSVDGIIYCCVGSDRAGVAEALAEADVPVLMLTPDTPLPVEVEYCTRPTLGLDRVAAAAGVAAVGERHLVVDAGTAVTIDLVDGLRFKGGNISPGLRLRFRSLNAFTSRLPLVSPDGELPMFGYDTDTAIRSGVVRGLVAELTAAWQEAERRYGEITMILAGGDAALLSPMLRDKGVRLEVDSEAVGRGLVRIFNHNYPCPTV